MAKTFQHPKARELALDWAQKEPERTVPDIYAELQRKRLVKDGKPTLRTVQGWVSPVRTDKDTYAWKPVFFDSPEDVRAIAGVQAAAMEKGFPRLFTYREAEYVARYARIHPSGDPVIAYSLARLRILLEAVGRPIDGIEWACALPDKTWRRAVDEGLVPDMPGDFKANI